MSHSILTFSLLLLSLVPVYAQTSTSPITPADAPTIASSKAQSTTTDPAHLLAVAAKLNGLDGSDVKPWHVKATYEIFDDEGKSKTVGTFEEWWVSDKKYKRSYVFPGFSQIDYITEKGLLRSGATDWVEDTAMWIPFDLFRPMMTPLRNYSFDMREQTNGVAHLRCVTLRQIVPDDPMFAGGVKPWMYCLDPDKPVLRAKFSTDGAQVVYNNLVLFQDHYVARNIQIERRGKPLLKIHVENIENLTAIQDADFIAPADAVSPPRRQIVSVNSLVPLRQDPPGYPPGARTACLSGTVIIQATIRKDGHTADLHLLSGPSLLQQAALDAVGRWVYKPVLLDGQPVEVQTQFSVVFTLDHVNQCSLKSMLTDQVR